MRVKLLICVRRFAWLLAYLSPASAAEAQLQCDRLFPAAISVGTTCEVVAEGQFPSWPPQYECDRTDIQIEPMEESGRLQIRSNAAVPHGVAWIRFFDQQSVSQLVPLLLEPIATLTEREPNNELASAHEIELPCTMNGRLEKNGDIDVYQVPIARGKLLSATVIASQTLGSPMDAVLQIADANGNVLAQNDDNRGIDPHLNFISSTDEVVFLRVFAFPKTPNSTIGFAGGKDFCYALRLSSEAGFDHCLPLINGNATQSEFHLFDNQGFDFQDPDRQQHPVFDVAPSAVKVLPATFISPPVVMHPQVPGWQWIPAISESATYLLDSNVPKAPVPPPAVCSGHISKPGEVDSFRFEAAKDAKYRAEVFSQRFGFGLDSVLRVVDPSSKQEIAVNDDLARNQYDAAIEFTSPKNGSLEIHVSDLANSGGDQHAYSMLVSQVKPQVELRVSAERFTVEAGNTSDIEISISRTNGFASRLQFEIASIDSQEPIHGVSSKAVISEPQGESSKSIKLQLHASDDVPNAHHPFRIQAREVAAEAAPGESTDSSALHAAGFEIRPNILMQRLWLTTQAKK